MGVILEPPAEPEKQRLPRGIKIFIGVGCGLVLWAGTFFLVVIALWVLPEVKTQVDLGTLVLGTTGIMLGIFTILIGGLAILGYQALKEGVQKDVEASTAKRIVTLEKELRGRVVGAIGTMLGMYYSSPSGLEPDDRRAERADYLAEAVDLCSQSYKILKDIEGNGKYWALNNFIFFACVQGKMGTRAGFLLEKAHELKGIGQEKSYWEALLTYCRAMLEFGERLVDIEDAQKLASRLSTQRELTERQKKEATSYVTSLADKLAERTAGVKGGPNPPDRDQ